MVNSGCFSCGKALSVSESDIIGHYYKLYKKFGQERYFYKLSKKGRTRIVKKSSFAYIYKTQIKPNLKNGAEYAHIQEYNAANSK